MRLFHVNDIFEAKMSPAVFQQTLQQVQSRALVGYEFEFILPNSSFYKGIERTTQRLNSVTQYRTYEKAFSFTDTLYQQLISDARLWAQRTHLYTAGMKDTELIQQYINDVFKGNIVSFHDSFDKRFNSPLLKPTPRYGWYDEKHRIFYTDPLDITGNETLDLIQQMFNTTFGKDTKYFEKAKEDASIMCPRGWTGVEIVTKPVEPNIGFYLLKKMFMWIEQVGGTTNKSTGLHINVSIKDERGQTPEIDWVKLALFLGEDYVAKLYDRIDNAFAQPQVRSGILSNIRIVGTKEYIAQNFDDIVDDLNIMVSSDKYSSFNILHYRDKGYVEFRIAGGENYHQMFEKAVETTMRFIHALTIATNDQLYRNEYIKKVTLLLQKAIVSRHGEGKQLSPIQQLVKDLGIRRFASINDKEQLLRVVLEIIAHDKKHPTILNDTYLKELRRLRIKFKITPEEIEQRIADPLVSNVKYILGLQKNPISA